MTYKVRIEIKVISTDFAELEVEANSPAEARLAAKELYLSDDCPELDQWGSDNLESSLDEEFIKDWDVVEV